MIRKILLTISALLSGVLMMTGARIEDAAAAYRNGDYGKAVEIYQQLEKENGTSSELYYDMGQAYTKAGKLGQAMLCYQRALKLNPYNSKARANAIYVDSKVQDANRAELKGKKLSVVQESPSFFISIKRYITHRHSSNAWAFWSALTFILFCVCVALYVFAGGVIWRKIGFFGGGTMLALSIIFIIFAFVTASEMNNHNTGVVTAFKVELRSDASTSAKNITSPLTQGTVMSVLETVDDKEGRPQWYKVRLNSDFVGWINSENFDII